MTITDEPQKERNQTIDKEKLRRKYTEERNKRLRADGNDQYIEVKGQLAHYLDDPVLAGDAKMKLGLYYFRLEPLVDVLDNCLGDISVSGL